MKTHTPSLARPSFTRIVLAALALLSLEPQPSWAGTAPNAARAPTPVTFTREEARVFLKVQSKLAENDKLSIDDFDGDFGHEPKDPYTAKQLALYLKSEAAQKKIPTREQLLQESPYKGSPTFPWLRLRRSFQDVLTAEDPSLVSNDKTGFDDLEGALFTYGRDFRQHSETWSSQAALLAPFSFYTGYAPLENEGFGVVRWGFVPSASLYRISTSGDPADEVEQQAYRAGTFMKLQSGHNALIAITGRAFASYLVDNIQDQSVTAAEFELEPVSLLTKKLRIGARTILIPKENPKDSADTAWLAYQFRLIVHGEFGSVNREGPAFNGREYDFFRLGPVVQLDFKPFIFKSLNISLKYSYLPALSGQSPNDQLFTADAEWAIHKDEDKLRLLSLKASYVDGGLDLTQEKARTLLIGIGAAF